MRKIRFVTSKHFTATAIVMVLIAKHPVLIMENVIAVSTSPFGYEDHTLAITTDGTLLKY